MTTRTRGKGKKKGKGLNKSDLRWLLRMGLKYLGRMPAMRHYTKAEKARLDRLVREQVARTFPARRRRR